MQDRAVERQRMVEDQLARRGISDAGVLEAMGRVPRERFVPAAQQPAAYEDRPLPIGDGQTISQPYIVARMAQAARIASGDRVLEVGTGSGYAAAVLGLLAGSVVTVERRPDLAEAARLRLHALGYRNVTVHVGDGSAGVPDEGPFDAILVAAAGPSVPKALSAQLCTGGRLIMPVGERRGSQRLLRVTRTGPGTCATDDLGGVQFVPLIGSAGWSEG